MKEELKIALKRLKAMVGNHTGFTIPDGYFENFDADLDTRMQSEKFPETSGFHTPDNYFDNFETELFDKIAEESLPKDTGFIAPEHYFETVESKVLERVQNTTPKKKLRNLVITFASSAAAMLLLYLSFGRSDESSNISFDALTATEINEWIQAGNMEVNSYDIAAIDDTVLNNSSFIYADISEEELNDYLDTVDPEYLYN